MEIYKLEAVCKDYQNNNAIKDINLSIDNNTILGLIGESGAGKTTLLRILAGLELPTSGNLSYKNIRVDTTTSSNLRKEATMLFQTPVFLRGDVFYNVAYGLRIRQFTENDIKKLIYDTLERVRLHGFENKDVNKLSVGEQQRISLARALILEPSVLLLDEPTLLRAESRQSLRLHGRTIHPGPAEPTQERLNSSTKEGSRMVAANPRATIPS